MGRRHDDRRIAVVLEPVDQLERSFLEPGERELVVVVFVPVVPGRDARDAAREALGQHDHARAVMLGDVGGPLRILRIGRMALQRGAVRDADEVGAERARLGLDGLGGERRAEDRDHQSRPSSVSAAALERRLRFLEFLQLARDHALVAFRADPAAVVFGKSRDRCAGVRAVLLPGLAERDLLGRPFRDDLLHVGKMRVIVVADRADREAARAIAERADHPQQALPEPEHVARGGRRSPLRRRHVDETFEELQDGGEAELLRLGRAGALVDPEMQHRVGRAGMQAAAAGLPDAHLLGDRMVRRELDLGQDAGEVHARSELGREDVDLEPERAESRLDAEMAGREPAIARALVVPVGLLRGGDEARVAGLFQLLGQRVGDLVHLPQHQHVDVLHRHVGLAAERARGNPLHQHDHALAVGRDAVGGLRPARVGRKRVERGGARDADEIGAELPGAALHGRGVDFAEHGALRPPGRPASYFKPKASRLGSPICRPIRDASALTTGAFTLSSNSPPARRPARFRALCNRD